MLKDRGHKGSWKGASNPNRTKKKSYGNIHSLSDRGIAEIYESFGNTGHATAATNADNGSIPSLGAGTGNGAGAGTGSAPTSPWASPKLGRKATVTISPSIDRSTSKLLPLQQ